MVLLAVIVLAQALQQYLLVVFHRIELKKAGCLSGLVSIK